MINTSIESGHVPGTMQLAKVIPIYKSKDKQMLNNYRPISLLPIFSKIIEKVIYQRLFNFLNTNNALFSSQYGFRKNHSTINAVTELVSHVITACLVLSCLVICTGQHSNGVKRSGMGRMV